MTEFEVKKQIAEYNRQVSNQYASLRQSARNVGKAAYNTATKIAWLVIGGVIIITLLVSAIAGALELWTVMGLAILVGVVVAYFAIKWTLGPRQVISTEMNKLNTTLDQLPKL